MMRVGVRTWIDRGTHSNAEGSAEKWAGIVASMRSGSLLRRHRCALPEVEQIGDDHD
jgi:hypothetical protein